MRADPEMAQLKIEAYQLIWNNALRFRPKTNKRAAEAALQKCPRIRAW